MLEHGGNTSGSRIYFSYGSLALWLNAGPHCAWGNSGALLILPWGLLTKPPGLNFKKKLLRLQPNILLSNLTLNQYPVNWRIQVMSATKLKIDLFTKNCHYLVKTLIRQDLHSHQYWWLPTRFLQLQAKDLIENMGFSWSVDSRYAFVETGWGYRYVWEVSVRCTARLCLHSTGLDWLSLHAGLFFLQ